MRYGRSYSELDPSQIEIPQYGVNVFIDINDGLIKGKYPDGQVKALSSSAKEVEMLEVPLTLTNSGSN